MDDDQDVESYWQVLRREEPATRPHTMNAAEAMERILSALWEYQELFEKVPDGLNPKLAFMRSGDDWYVLAHWGAEFSSHKHLKKVDAEAPSLEEALEKVFLAARRLIAEHTKTLKDELLKVRTEMEKAQLRLREATRVLNKMGDYTPYEPPRSLTLPFKDSNPFDIPEPKIENLEDLDDLG